jgi:hypothetical protein
MTNILENRPQRKGVAREIMAAPDRDDAAATLPLSSKRDFALDARRRGLRVYPMEANSTEPAFPEADCVATTDETQNKEWWKEDPDRNIGIATDNLLALRVKTASAATALGHLLQSHPDTPKTARIILDVAGREQESHVLFLVPKGANAQARSNIVPGVDALAFDDVIIGPGSTLLNGAKCIFANGNPAAAAPLWLMNLCGVQLPEGKTTNVVAPKKPAPAVATKSKMEWALEAALYIPVFPIRPYVDPGADASPEQREAAVKAAKTPLIANWQNLATQDPKQIREWFRQWPDANIGGVTENLIVVDVDTRNGGNETFTALNAAEGFPETATSNTQGGGKHLFYVAPGGKPLKGGTHKLGQGIDIKARGGYVLLPGSTIEGRAYTRANDRPMAFAPAWIVDKLKAARQKTDAAGKRLVEEDEEAIERATNWMLKHAPTATTGNIDDTMYRVSTKVFDFGVSLETATDIVLEWNELKCDPPGNVDRLLVVVESASRNRENAIGCLHSKAPGFEPVEIAERPAPASREAGSTASAANATALKAVPLAPFEPADIPQRPWIIPGFACRGRVTMLAGPGGVSKSTYYLMVAIAVASGRGDICGYAVPKPDRVWVWNQEDDLQEMQRRLAAIMSFYNVSWDDLKDENGELRTFVSSGVETPLILATRRDYGVVPTAQVGEIIAEVKANRIGTLILDPLVEFHEASENDNVQMRAVVGQVRRIAQEGDCATLLATHTRKPPQASSDGFAGEMDAARGASAQLGVVRIGATIFSMSPKDAKAYQLPAGKTYRDFVRLDIAKNNLAPVLPEPIWFQREGVTIGGGFERTGESVGLLRPVKLVKKAGDKASAAPHLPTVLASIIANKLSREKWWKLSDVVAAAAPEQLALFGTAKHRAALIDSAFDGNTECTTDSGRLARTESAPGKPTTLRLGPTSQPPKDAENTGGEVENGD